MSSLNSAESHNSPSESHVPAWMTRVPSLVTNMTAAVGVLVASGDLSAQTKVAPKSTPTQQSRPTMSTPLKSSPALPGITKKPIPGPSLADPPTARRMKSRATTAQENRDIGQSYFDTIAVQLEESDASAEDKETIGQAFELLKTLPQKEGGQLIPVLALLLSDVSRQGPGAVSTLVDDDDVKKVAQKLRVQMPTLREKSKMVP